MFSALLQGFLRALPVHSTSQQVSTRHVRGEAWKTDTLYALLAAGDSLRIQFVGLHSMLAFFAYVASLVAAAAGFVMLLQIAVAPDKADKNAIAAKQARTVPAPITKPALSSASKPVDRSEEASKRKKAAARPRHRSAVAERRREYSSPPEPERSYSNW